MNKLNIFTGIFDNEQGQRFLRIMNQAADNAFAELYTRCIPNQLAKFSECLQRVNSWNLRLLEQETLKLQTTCPDSTDMFRAVYVEYVKSMRGSTHTKVLLNIPPFERFLHSFYKIFATHKSVRNANYFKHAGPLEQRITCMETVRDALFEYLGDDYVQLEPIVPTIHETANISEKEVKLEHEKANSIYDIYNRCEPSLINENDNDSVTPDDSVSNINFSDRQQDLIQQFKTQQQNLRNLQAVPENADANSQNSDNTHCTLSSISISQRHSIPKNISEQEYKQRKKNRQEDNLSEVSKHSSQHSGSIVSQTKISHKNNKYDKHEHAASELTSSSIVSSCVHKEKNEKCRPQCKSYVTHLTEMSDDI